MITIEFTVLGNQNDHEGNPLGYKVVTHKGRFTDVAQRYERWKEYVRGEFLASFKKIPRRFQVFSGKPIILEKDEWAEIQIDIYNADEKRCDNTNILKGVEDALFENDKMILAQQTLARLKQGKGKLIIKIIIYERGDH